MTNKPTNSLIPTREPLSVGDNGLMIPIAALLAPQAHEAEPKSLAVSLPEDDDDDFDGSGSFGGNNVMFGMLASGALMMMMM